MNTVRKIIAAYNGGEPLTAYLKKYFSANKKHGSKDRKQITGLCYNFYRLGKALPHTAVDKKIITATFLCAHSHNEFLQFHNPEWNNLTSRTLIEKIAFLDFPVNEIFPWENELSSGIDLYPFCCSFLTQPDLFLRIRPGKKNIGVKKLLDAGLSFEMPEENTIALPNATKLDTVIELDLEMVVQDINSQKVLDIFKSEKVIDTGVKITAWDCCAASGGKSILAFDLLQHQIDLTVSDIRESILANLKKRFSAAGINHYHSFVADLSTVDCQLPIAPSQLIICDAPCTGSGTWSRTPEQLYFFKEEMITDYAEKQKKIISNVIPHLQANGLFVYITCSVFKKENEEIVNFIKEKFHLQLIQIELLKGFDKKADTMFTAVFINKTLIAS